MASSSHITGSDRTWLPIDQLLRVPDTHLHHPQLLLISNADARNHRRYNYLSWQVTHPPTAVAWSEGKWYEFHHSLTTGQPYHEGHHIEVYPTRYTQTPKMNRHPRSTYRSEAHERLSKQTAQEAHTEKGTTSKERPSEQT